MENHIYPEAAVLVIFGAGGDLTRRKLVPALYDLFLDRYLPQRFAIIGIDLQPLDDERFRQRMRDGVDQFSRRGKPDDTTWHAFAQRLSIVSANFSDPAIFTTLAQQLNSLDETWDTRATRVFYVATPPTLVEPIAQQLGKARLARDRRRTRLVIEKPFGHDLASACVLDALLTEIFDESQIYRIDHYLGKETVQNILAFRFANALFEPIWDRRYIDHVQITVAESVGVEHRGGYYDRAGALRDMVQNHLLQLLCLIAMEPPVAFEADEIRNKKVDVLQAIRSIKPDEVHLFAVRGQYDAGWIDGTWVPAYRSEPGVAPDSQTETFAALKLFIDNWRWQDIPFYLRTGKRLPARVSEVVIQLRPAPHQLFPPSAVGDWQPNRLAINIQPVEGILIRFQAKQPGLRLRLGPEDMIFTYKQAFETPSPDAYETLLLDVIRGDATQFMRSDQVELAWSVVMPILEAWAATPADFPNYGAGTWGPEAAEMLLARDARRWLLPSFPLTQQGQAQTLYGQPTSLPLDSLHKQ
jgi:glucose-6-phosphate 1-dehydrogenase